jgi:riboflavin kinase / FMN adenylyltransferase
VVVGENFRFGHKAAGDPALLAGLGRPRGIEVVAVPLRTSGDEVVSSTRVRAELAAGDVAAAAASLGRPHAVEGLVVVGDRRGGPLLGVPTANLEVPDGIAIPADGVYAGHLTDEGADQAVARPAAISVGTNPQFGTDRRVEAHVLDFDGDLYGHRVSVAFTHRLRGQATFPDLDHLIAQIKADVDQARRLLSSPPGGTVRTGGFSRPTP